MGGMGVREENGEGRVYLRVRKQIGELRGPNRKGGGQSQPWLDWVVAGGQIPGSHEGRVSGLEGNWGLRIELIN